MSQSNFIFIFVLTCCLSACKQSRVSFHSKITIPELGLSVNQYEISIAAFAQFIDATNYITTADSLTWSGVFDVENKNWSVVKNANWIKPTGEYVYPPNYPVSQVSYYDACAYCEWKKGRLPTAAEWDAIAGNEIIKSNVWEGNFPFFDEGNDGYQIKVAPVGEFIPNEYNIHDLFGNVWEWTSTSDEQGMMIIKGGSFLCDLNVCRGYIPSHYQTTAKDSGLNHLGFRCVFEE